MKDNEFIRYERVKKTYDGKDYVVRQLDLTVRRGEFLTLLGPSGSGKTTTLMMLAGFEAPTSGEIYLDGVRIDQMPAHRRDIGVVFQNYALFPHMTVAENIAFPLQMRGVNSVEAARRVSAALENVRMAAFASRRPAQLSGGQQQRVALARALVFEPKLVLMDEPLGALDKQLREHMQLEIKQLHARLGVTIVYVTHDQGEALTMSDRVGVFNEGVLQQLASPRELYEAPANPFIAQFIGENNSVAATVAGIEGEHCDVVTAQGARFRAVSTPGLAVGAPATLCLRPEKIQVLSSSEPGLNAARGLVRDVVYHGDHVRLQVRDAGTSGDLTVKAPNSPEFAGLRVDSEVLLGWKPGDCRALPTAS